MKDRIALWAVIGTGIIAMCAAEIAPEWAWWAPVLFIGIGRAYIIILTPRVKALVPESATQAAIWVWGTSILTAWYIWTLYTSGRITAELHTSLQVSNILAIGAEWYFSQVSGASKPEDLRGEIERLEIQLTYRQATVEELQAENETLQDQLEEAKRAQKLLPMLTTQPRRLDRVTKEILCPHCLTFVAFGHRATEVTHCGKTIYTPKNEL